MARTRLWLVPTIQRCGRSLRDVAALAALLIGGAFALTACGSGAGAEPAQTPAREEQPGQPAAPGQAETEREERPTVYMVQRPEDPVIHLNQDADLAAFARPRDTSRDPKREPGPISVPRGVPTFFRAPIAHTPEDLKAGKVDVAFLGAPLDMGSGMRGAGWGPRGLRALDPRPGGVYTGPPDPSGTPASGENPNMHVMLDPFAVLNVVDYGDAPIDNLSTERTMEPVRAMVREIAATGAIPFIVGGDHSLEYANVAGLADVYGKGNVGVIHFDSHFDAWPIRDHLMSHGQPVRRVVEEGHVLGKNYIQVGLRGYGPSENGFRWMRQQGMRYHTMAQVDRDGWDRVMTRVLAEALDGPEKLHISFDIDVIDPAFAPGTGTPEPGGPTPREMMPLVRNLCAQKNIVGMDIVEVAPLLDPAYVTTLVANRILKECLTGIAMRKKGITDPDYLSPLVTDWQP